MREGTRISMMTEEGLPSEDGPSFIVQAETARSVKRRAFVIKFYRVTFTARFTTMLPSTSKAQK